MCNTAIRKNCLPRPASLPLFETIAGLSTVQTLTKKNQTKIRDFASAPTKNQNQNLSHLVKKKEKNKPCNSCHLFVYDWRSERQLHFSRAKTSLKCRRLCWTTAWLHLPAAIYQTRLARRSLKAVAPNASHIDGEGEGLQLREFGGAGAATAQFVAIWIIHFLTFSITA